MRVRSLPGSRLGAAIGLSMMLLAAPAAAGPKAPAKTSAKTSAKTEPKAATAAKRKEAKQRFERGLELFDDGDLRAALIEFNRAYALAPHWRVQFNIGKCAFKLHDYVVARRAFTRYLLEGGKKVPKDRRKEANEALGKLRTRVATVALTISQPGAEVSVDDVLIGKTPLEEPVVVSTGRRKLTVLKPGYAPVTRYVDVAGGDALKLTLELSPLSAPGPRPGPVEPAAPSPAPSPSPAPEPGPAPTPAEPSDPTLFIVALGVTVAAGAATAATGALALNAKSEFDERIDTFPSTAEEVVDAKNKVTTFTVAADASAALTLVGGICTIVAGVYTFGGDDGGAEAALVVRPNGLGLNGRF